MMNKWLHDKLYCVNVLKINLEYLKLGLNITDKIATSIFVIPPKPNTPLPGQKRKKN